MLDVIVTVCTHSADPEEETGGEIDGDVEAGAGAWNVVVGVPKEDLEIVLCDGDVKPAAGAWSVELVAGVPEDLD